MGSREVGVVWDANVCTGLDEVLGAFREFTEVTYAHRPICSFHQLVHVRIIRVFDICLKLPKVPVFLA